MIQYNNTLVVSITTSTDTTSTVVERGEFGTNVVNPGPLSEFVDRGMLCLFEDDMWEADRYFNTESYAVTDPTTIADILLQQDSMWDNDHTVVEVRKPTTVTPGEARVVCGEVSSYTSETCPVCGRVYSGADIRRHLRTHTRTVRKQRHVLNLRIKEALSEVVLEQATRVTHTYESESEGLTDTNAHNELPGAKWAAMKDAHIQEMKDAYIVGRGGTNPKYTYFWRQAHTREERTQKLAQWIRTAHLSAVLRAMNSKTLHSRRMRTLSATLGFKATPKGKWPEVDSSDELGLHRVHPTTMYGRVVNVIRLPDYSSLYLTKEQVSYLHSLMEKRKEGGNRVVTAPTRGQVVVKPITKADIPDNWAQIMTGVHTLR